MRTAIVQEELPQEIWTPSPPTFFPSTVPLDSELLEGLQPSALSVDVTNLCNLRCKHCFWDAYDEALPAGTNEHILDSVKAVLKKYPSITNITWYGGEPLISNKTIALVQQGLKLKKNNLIMTNGTFPIPEWRRNVHFGVSIDGTQTIHDTLRGVNAYNRSKKNILSAIAEGVSVGILYCLNAVNIDCVADFLEEWAEVKPIIIGFTVYTPIVGKPSSLTLNDGQREKIVSLLARMKKKYGQLIYNTEAMIELIHVKYGKELAQHCPMNVFNRQGKVYSLHMCNDGNIRFPCAMGEDADHLHCRSITKVALYAAKVLRDKDSLRALLRMYHSKPHYEEKELFA
jgi:sulfatase maturation enzyme AslB (radical SAM superfamily)